MQNELGNIIIDSNAIAQIAYKSVMECYGVVGFGTVSKTSNLIELLKGDAATTKGIKVVQEDNLKLEVYIIVQYGVNINTVASNIVEKINYNIENMLGLKVSHININVQGVQK